MPEIVLGGTRVTGDATAGIDWGGEFDAGVKGFEEAGLGHSIGDFFFFALQAGERSQVIPDDQARRIDEQGEFDSVMLGILQQLTPGFCRQYGWRQGNVAGGAVF